MQALSEEIRNGLDAASTEAIVDYLRDRFPEPTEPDTPDPLWYLLLVPVLDGRRVRPEIEHVAHKLGLDHGCHGELVFSIDQQGHLNRSRVRHEPLGNTDLERYAQELRAA